MAVQQQQVHQQHVDQLVYHQLLKASTFSSPESGLSYNASAPRKRSRPITPISPSLPELPTTSTSDQDLFSHLYQHTLDVDTLIHFQNERLRLYVEELQRRHYRAVLIAVEQEVARRLKEKETELEDVKNKNLELEQKLRQLASENQVWFNVAKNNEAVVSGLRLSLEQALLRNAGAGTGGPAVEGFGESGGVAFGNDDDDAQSCCGGGGGAAAGGRWRGGCKVCGKREACVVVLPCRHLCLCDACESKVDTCPVCMSKLSSCLHVFLS
ncbi:E3 ubiquitin-protein ligase BOI-like protein [Dioscorea alata]|uniref:E3 ubiquitin-protein ligase BOI-like protein n=1 Tax=Dioscorea alata TaxID=55571 RepID=A0ACB7UTG9_DIOAL|nr:E3 ubiquitin-protein ligase BOI-like protein [Dioscorea alata]